MTEYAQSWIRLESPGLLDEWHLEREHRRGLTTAACGRTFADDAHLDRALVSPWTARCSACQAAHERLDRPTLS